MGTIAVHPLTPERRADFWAVHRAPACRGCACVAWWVPTWEEWDARTPEQNEALRDQLFAQGEDDGYLIYDRGLPVGWLQAGPRDRLPKLARMYRLTPDPAAWAITCFQILPEHRGRGLATALLRGAVADLRARGVRLIEAFPVHSGPEVSPGERWTGTVGLFTRAGFRPVPGDPALPVLIHDEDSPCP
jgi:GNAT superfamily N-acetyltransferase